MEENKDKYSLSPSDVQKLKLAPPENAWSLLETELDKKAALRNAKSVGISKPVQFGYIGVVLFIALIITYSYLSPVRISYLSVSLGLKEVQPNASSNVGNISNENKKEDATYSLQPKSSSVDNASKDITAPLSKTNDKASIGPGTVKNKSKNYVAKKPGKPIPSHTAALTNMQDHIKSLANKNPNKTISKDKRTSPGDISNIKEKQVASMVPALNESPTEINSKESKDEKETTSPKEISTDDSQKQAPVIVENKEPVLIKKDTEQSFRHTDSLAWQEGKINRFSIAAFYSPNYTRNHLKENGSVPSENVMEYYDHEKSAYSFSAGITVGYDISKHWSLATGGIYSTLSYSSDLPVIHAGYDGSNELQYRYPTSCGTIEIPNPAQTPLQKGDSLNLNTKCSQVVRFITIPLTIRYQVPLNRFSFYVYSGVSANFVMQSRARLNLTPNSSGSETTIINKVDGLKKMNYGYLFGAGIQYNFNNGMCIFIEPSYRGSVNSLTENISVYCYPYSFGLNTGVSFHF